jgi:hypothetical protein
MEDPLGQLLALASAHNYLALAILTIGWVLRLLSPQSKFPVTLPLIAGRDARPLVGAVLGLTYGILVAHKAGEAWLPAIEHGAMTGLLTLGLFDLIVKFVWNGKAPSWIDALAGVFPKAKPPEDPAKNEK